jgi:multiple sugar transport system permease protein
MAMILAVFVVPFLWTLGLGFTDFSLWSDPTKGINFVGLRNFKRLLGDRSFYNSAAVTFSFVGLAVSGHLVLGLLFANLVRIPGIRFTKIVSVSMLIPWLTPGLVAGYMWRAVLNVDYGWLNDLLQAIGLGRFDWLRLRPLFSVLLVNWSRGMAVAFILLSAGLESIPPAVFDACKIDGASAWQTFVHIKIPMIRYNILLTLLMNTFGTLLAFDMVYALTGGGPLGRTEVFAIYLYNQAFGHMFLGYAGAASTVILALTLALGLLYIRINRVER